MTEPEPELPRLPEDRPDDVGFVSRPAGDYFLPRHGNVRITRHDPDTTAEWWTIETFDRDAERMDGGRGAWMLEAAFRAGVPL